MKKSNKQDNEAIRRVFEYEALPPITISSGSVVISMSSATKWWGCNCGYAMPEPLTSCVKCGAKRKDK